MTKFASLALAVDLPARLYLVHPGTKQHITDPAGQDPAWIDLYSADSLQAQQARRVMLDRRGQMKGRALTPEEMDAEAAEFLGAVTAGWHLRGLSGAKLDVPFTQTNAAELYAERGLLWVRDQADAFVAQRGNFVRT